MYAAVRVICRESGIFMCNSILTHENRRSVFLTIDEAVRDRSSFPAYVPARFPPRLHLYVPHLQSRWQRLFGWIVFIHGDDRIVHGRMYSRLPKQRCLDMPLGSRESESERKRGEDGRSIDRIGGRGSILQFAEEYSTTGGNDDVIQAGSPF